MRLRLRLAGVPPSTYLYLAGIYYTLGIATYLLRIYGVLLAPRLGYLLLPKLIAYFVGLVGGRKLVPLPLRSYYASTAYRLGSSCPAYTLRENRIVLGR